MSIIGIPNSYSIPGVSVNITVDSDIASDNSFNVLVIGKASANSAYATNPELYVITTLSQLGTDFGTDSDVYKIVSQYKSIDVSTSIYALNVIEGTSTETVSNGNITEINTSLLTTSQTTDMAGTAVSASGGSGTGATFDITSTSNDAKTAFTPASVKINGAGSGYVVGDKLTIPNVGTITVTGIDSETVTVAESDLVNLNNALPNIGNVSFDIITGRYNSALAIQALDNYFTGTWSYAEETYGHYITVYQQNDITQAIKDSADFNKETCSAIIIPTDLDPDMVLGSAVSQIAMRVQENPSLPLMMFSLDVGKVSIANRWNKSTRNTLFANGFCTIVCDTAGNPTLENTRIGATTDAEGETIGDTTLETRFQAVYIAKTYRSGLSKYIDNPRIIMGDSDTLPVVSYVVTPSSIRSDCINIYNSLISDLICTDLADFKTNLSVSVDSSVIGRMDVSMIVYLAQGLKQIAINLTVEK
ncbi:hypothetical protein [Acetobacter pasteurianus]|uniref:Uncharacterized protein n=1 Tax=Acetobacter pasteurianus subsp. pasteurianus TaxID=481145 RepID=A0A1Y0Y528_ACEPA|nr:hypothetical protein [Acetobacter pasteurianus]ARW49482.1 hypothetical protein S1001342_03192 [Acetobacter pasteurianus subsp. pasteurianus]